MEGPAVRVAEDLERAALPVPKMEDALPVLRRLPEWWTAVLLHAVDPKGEYCERHEVVPQLVLAEAEIVLESVRLPRLQFLERLFLDCPPAAVAPRDGH